MGPILQPPELETTQSSDRDRHYYKPSHTCTTYEYLHFQRLPAVACPGGSVDQTTGLRCRLAAWTSGHEGLQFKSRALRFVVVTRRPCSDFMDMLWHLISRRIIIIIIYAG